MPVSPASSNAVSLETHHARPQPGSHAAQALTVQARPMPAYIRQIRFTL